MKPINMTIEIVCIALLITVVFMCYSYLNYYCYCK